MNTAEIAKKELLDLFDAYAARIDLLNSEQMTLVRFFQSNPNYRVIAKMAGVNEATIARRLKKIARLISNNNFIADLSLNNDVPPEKMKIIRSYPLNGMGLRTLSKNTGLSIYKIRKVIRKMRDL